MLVPTPITVLGGFIQAVHARDVGFGDSVLDGIIGDPHLAARLPYFQARVAVDAGGIVRFRKAIARGVLTALDFQNIANGSVSESPPDDLGLLLLDIAKLPGGVEIALDILHMHFYRDKEEGRERAPSLIAVGCDLLLRADFSQKETLRDFGLHTVICICCAGAEGEATLRKICAKVRDGLETVHLSSYDLGHVLKALFETHPLIALDEFLRPDLKPRNRGVFEGDFGDGTPVDDVGAEVLCQWADIDPDPRYLMLSKSIAMFKRQQSEEGDGVSGLFLEVLAHAPDKRTFLGDIWSRIHPRSWAGSLADVLVRRRAAITAIGDELGEEVGEWVASALPELDRWIDRERDRDRSEEQSFE